MRVTTAPTLTAADRAALSALIRTRTAPLRQVERARIVLLAADGKQDVEIAAKLGCSRRRPRTAR